MSSEELFLTRLTTVPAIEVRHNDSGKWTNKDDVRAWGERVAPQAMRTLNRGSATEKRTLSYGEVECQCEKSRGWVIWDGTRFRYVFWLDDREWRNYTTGTMRGMPAQGFGDAVLVHGWPNIDGQTVFAGDYVVDANGADWQVVSITHDRSGKTLTDLAQHEDGLKQTVTDLDGWGMGANVRSA